MQCLHARLAPEALGEQANRGVVEIDHQHPCRPGVQQGLRVPALPGRSVHGQPGQTWPQ